MIKHSLQIGSILYSSWGYEQTNIDFYEVTKLIGKCTIEIREIAQTRETHNYNCLSGKTRPIASKYVDQPMKKRVNEYNRIKISSFQSASIWGGEELYYSSYY